MTIDSSTLPHALTSFHWTHGGSTVMLIGSFTNWKETIPMVQETAGFCCVLNLPIGIHSYKFIVDGEWRFSPDQETITDSNGNINNCISVTCSVPFDKAKAIPIAWSPSQTRKSPSLTKQLTRNQLLIPGVEEVARNIPPKLQRGTSSHILQTYAAGGAEALARGSHKLLVVMVGLPARGKSFISRKLCRYLNWLGFVCKVFNAGNYRRDRFGGFVSHDWFRPDNPEGVAARNSMAVAALDDCVNWFRNSNGAVGIFDATNSTSNRRQLILERMKSEKPNLYIKTIFVEVICNDKDVIDANIRATKLSSPDYVGKNISPDDIVKDFTERIEHYKQAYETLSQEENYRYIKIFDVGRQIVANRITGFLPGKVMFYLSNLHIAFRPIYFVRHGQSEYNVLDRVGGDSSLTPLGFEFAQRLSEFMCSEIPNPQKDLCVWSSTMQRAVQTAELVPCVQYIRWKAMEEISVGIADGMSYEEFEEKYPEEYTARSKDKLRYRYPRGESYEDLIRRVEPVITELERQRKPILIVAHRAILRCLYAYFAADTYTRDQVPYLDFPLHTVVKLAPRAYGTEETVYNLMPL